MFIATDFQNCQWCCWPACIMAEFISSFFQIGGCVSDFLNLNRGFTISLVLQLPNSAFLGRQGFICRKAVCLDQQDSWCVRAHAHTCTPSIDQELVHTVWYSSGAQVSTFKVDQGQKITLVKLARSLWVCCFEHLLKFSCIGEVELDDCARVITPRVLRGQSYKGRHGSS